MLNCRQLVEQHLGEWERATRHPFLDRCAAGTIEPRQFHTWLVQDYLFVMAFTRMTARLLAVAPARHIDHILAGLASLQGELFWFREKAAERRLDLDAPMQPACRRYVEFMEFLAAEHYAIQATAFWAIEAAYNQAWQLPGPMKAPYDEFAERWGNHGFSSYVDMLAQQADEALASVPPATRERAEKAFLQVASLEADFWQMAFA